MSRLAGEWTLPNYRTSQYTNSVPCHSETMNIHCRPFSLATAAWPARTAVLLAALALPGIAPAAQLMNVYQRAQAQDMQLQAARHGRDAALEARPIARAALLPQLGASYGYQDQQETGTEGFGGGPETPVDRDSTLLAFGVRLDQVLFDWSAFQRYAQSGDEVALAMAQYRKAEQSLMLRAAQTYFDALSAADTVRLAAAEKQAFVRQLDQARTRFEVGLAAVTEIQEAQARHDLSVASEITARQQLANAREALREITGQAELALMPLREEIPLLGPEPATVGPWIDAAQEHNLDLLAAMFAQEAARRGVDVARGGHLPRVGAMAEYQDADADGARFTGEIETETLGVMVELPLFSGLATRARVNQARFLHEQREAELEGTRRGVERGVRDAFLAVESGVARVRALRQAVQSSRTALEASEVGLEVGTRTSVDVLNAQSALFSAERDYSRARYDYLLSVLALKAAAGSLGEPDLSEVDALLVHAPGEAPAAR